MTKSSQRQTAAGWIGTLLFVGPVLTLFILWRQGKPVHTALPGIDIAIRFGLVLLPFTLAALMSRKPLKRDFGGDVVLQSHRAWKELVDGWYSALPLLVPAIVGAIVCIEQAISLLRAPERVAPMSAGMALLIWFTSAIVGLLLGSMLLETYSLRITDEGFRTGMTQVIPWGAMHHVSMHGSTLYLYHRFAPALPFARITEYAAVRSRVEPALKAHAIPHDDAVSIWAGVYKLGALLITTACVTELVLLAHRGVMRPVWVVALSLGVMLVLGLASDWLRGSLKTTRMRGLTAEIRKEIDQEAQPSGEDPTQQMAGLDHNAVTDARSLHSITLNYSADSVREVEQILSQLHGDYRTGLMDLAEAERQSLKWGAYVGAVICKLYPYRWQSAGDGSINLAAADGSMVFPVTWCFKRIVDGPDDNVWAKFEVLFRQRPPELSSLPPADTNA